MKISNFHKNMGAQLLKLVLICCFVLLAFESLTYLIEKLLSDNYAANAKYITAVISFIVLAIAYSNYMNAIKKIKEYNKSLNQIGANDAPPG